MSKHTIQLTNGDEVEIGETKYRVVNDELFKIDNRSPVEARLDALEARVKQLENAGSGWGPMTYPPINPAPTNPYTPWPGPTTTWISSPSGNTQCEGVQHMEPGKVELG